MTQILFDLPKLGFGLMRLPVTEGAQVDMAQTRQMVDRFMAAGFTYFDTAWGYMNGMSEVAARETIVSRYPRASFQLADKLPIWALESEGDARAVFGTQLARTGAGYFDFYLAHSLNANHVKKMDELNLWAFLRELKAQGLARHIGFSFHDDIDCLRGILDAHPEIEFVQLQVNYADWDSQAVQSRLCYEECARRALPVVVMEPVKGGLLADLPDAARAPLAKERPDDSCAAWALRYAGSLEHAPVVLSGMSNLLQLEENVKLFSNFEPLTTRDQAALGEALHVLNAVPTVGCTGCGYCLAGCPSSIEIPGVIDAYNCSVMYGLTPAVRGQYEFASREHKPGDCISCGACEQICPQHLAIIETLAAAAHAFNTNPNR